MDRTRDRVPCRADKVSKGTGKFAELGMGPDGYVIGCMPPRRRVILTKLALAGRRSCVEHRRLNASTFSDSCDQRRTAARHSIKRQILEKLSRLAISVSIFSMDCADLLG